MTLTVRGYHKDVTKAYRELTKWFDSFRKTMQRASKGVRWEYCAFVEAQVKTRGGMPHFHIIALSKPRILKTVIDPKTKKPKRSKDRKVVRTTKRFKDVAWDAGFGYQAKVKRVMAGKAAGYVAKYASKVDANMPKGFRRVRASEGWSDIPSNNGEFDLLVKGANETLSEYLIRVNNTTNIPIDELLYRWYEATIIPG